MDSIVWVFITILVTLFMLLFVIGNEREKHHEVFNAECLKDHKQYECDVLWNQANKKDQSNDMALGMAMGMAMSRK